MTSPEATKQAELRAACELVERLARSVGRDCEVIFLSGDVQVAPLSWSGCVNAPTLYEALTQALAESEEP